MPGVRESGKNWTFSTFQADEKLGAVSMGWNSGVVGFSRLHVCLYKHMTYGWPPHVLRCYVNVIEVRYQLTDLKGLWMDMNGLYIYIYKLYTYSIHIIYNICLHVHIYIITFIWHQNISERNNYMQLRDMFEQSFPSGSDQFLAGFRGNVRPRETKTCISTLWKLLKRSMTQMYCKPWKQEQILNLGFGKQQ